MAHSLLLRAVPDGFEPLRQACRRTGFVHETLRAMLVRYGVEMRRGYGRDHRNTHRAHVLYVNKRAVDRVVAKEMTLETLEVATARYAGRVSQVRIRAALVAAGLIAHRPTRCKMRLDPARVDAAVAAWTAT